MFIAYLFITYLLVPFIVVVGLDKLLKQRTDSSIAFFLTNWGAGVLLIPFFLEIVLRLSPGATDNYYIFVTLLPFLAMGWFLRKPAKELGSEVAEELRRIHIRLNENLLFCSLAVLFGCAVISALFYFVLLSPIGENDILQYAKMAQFFYDDKDLSSYPFVEAERKTGFFAVTAHPLAFHLSFVWAHLFQGSAENLGFARVIPLVFLILQLCLLLGLFWRRPLEGFVATVLLLAFPLYGYLVRNFSIDSIRIYSTLFAFFCLFRLLKEEEFAWRKSVYAGIGLGLSLFTHAMGFVILPIYFAILFLNGRAHMRSAIAKAFSVGFIALPFCFYRVLENLHIFGSPINDSGRVLQLPTLQQQSLVELGRGYFDLGDKFFLGVFQAFSNPSNYSFIYWLLLPAILVVLICRIFDLWTRICLQFVALFWLLVSSTVLFLGKSDLIDGPRYLVTLHPFVVSILAVCWARLWEGRRNA